MKEIKPLRHWRGGKTPALKPDKEEEVMDRTEPTQEQIKEWQDSFKRLGIKEKEETMNEMRERHTKEIADLQENCEHKKHHRLAREWAPGHFGNDIEVCDNCGKILEVYSAETGSSGSQITTNPYIVWY